MVAPRKYPQLADIDWLRRETSQRGAAAVAGEVGCGIDLVLHTLRRKGFPYEQPAHVDMHSGGRGQRRRDHPRRDEAIARRRGGETVSSIARDLDLSTGRVQGWMRPSRGGSELR